MPEAAATAPISETVPDRAEPVSQHAAPAQPNGAAPSSAEIVLPFPPEHPLTDELLEQLGDLSPQHLIERGPRGELVISPVARSGSGRITSRLAQQCWNWLDAAGGGGEFDGPDPGIIVDGHLEVRQADFSYFTAEQVARMPKEGIDAGFADEVPAFVVEVRSKSQSVEQQVARCLKWIADGAEVAWMIDPFNETVHIVRVDSAVAGRKGQVIAVHQRPETIEVGPELPGLTITFERIWKS